jgi:beta-lactamase class A
MAIQRVIDEVVAATPGVAWSIRVTGLPELVAGREAERRLRTASIGKILLLTETARQIAEGTLDPSERLARRPELAVADSGLWQHLAVASLPVADAATLVAAVSDNYATNVLLERIGLDRVAGLARALGLRETSLNDYVRGHREAHHPATLSTGSAGELAGLMDRIAGRRLVSAAVSDQLDRWLAINVDLSMVASAFQLDPLAHVDRDRGVLVRNKTGTDDGIRADVGYLRAGTGTVAYAVLANWDAVRVDATAAVMTAMRAIGAALDTE